MRTNKNIFLALMALPLFFAGCDKDDNEDKQPVSVVEDGFYITGSATSNAELTSEWLFDPAVEEGAKVVRDGLYEIFALLKPGEFKLTQVVAEKKSGTLGGTPKYTYNGVGAEGDDQIRKPADYYDASESGAAIQIAETGLYHIIYETQLKRIIVINASEWGLRGALNGWGFTVLTPNSDFTEFTANVNIREAGNFKFAHSQGWKLGVDDTTVTATIKVNTNLGGTKDNLAIGGGDIPQFSSGDEAGNYTVTLKFTPGRGFSVATFTRTGDLIINQAGIATFQVRVPGALESSQVGVVGNFADSSWKVPGYLMTKNDTTYTLTANVPAGFTYKYVISNYDGNSWIWEDGSNREMPTTGPLNVTDEVKKWSGKPFDPPATEVEGTFTITINNHPGEGWKIYFTGNFANKSWGESDREMTLKAGTSNVYTWTGEYPITGFEYKIIAKKEGENDKWSSGNNVEFDGSNFNSTLSF
jgi:hypothetical protein